MDRVASRRTVVNEIWSVLTPVVVRVAAWAALRTSWVAVSQAQTSWRARSGSLLRRIGPREGPASVMVDLFSPIVVSEVISSQVFDHGLGLGEHVEDSVGRCPQRALPSLSIFYWHGPIVAEV
jgi:hypothetical protein